MSNQIPEVGTFCWNELMTSDAGAAKEFYGSLFGWEVNEMDMGPAGTYTMFKQGDTDIGGMMQIPADQAQMIPPHWMSYIAVSDLDAMVEKAKSLGANVLQTLDVGDFGRLAVIEDPTGAHFSFWQSLTK